MGGTVRGRSAPHEVRGDTAEPGPCVFLEEVTGVLNGRVFEPGQVDSPYPSISSIKRKDIYDTWY